MLPRHRGSGGDGCQRAPVERFLRGDDAKLVRTAVGFGVLASDLQRTLVGFGPGVAEKDPVHAADAHQLFGQLCHGGGVIVAGCVNQRRRLLLNGLNHAGVAVAERVDSDACQEVQILFAARVPDAHSLPAHEGNWQAGVDGQQVLVIEVLDVGVVNRGRDVTRFGVHGVGVGSGLV